jgi:uncharacterized membrane protein
MRGSWVRIMGFCIGHMIKSYTNQNNFNILQTVILALLVAVVEMVVVVVVVVVVIAVLVVVATIYVGGGARTDLST